MSDPFAARGRLTVGDSHYTIYRLAALEGHGAGPADLSALPYSLRILLESLLRGCDTGLVDPGQVRELAGWKPQAAGRPSLSYRPARVIMQDFTGVPAIVDLGAMRSAMARLGGDPVRVNPQVAVDLVIDHSVQVDHFGTADSLARNAEIEFRRNRERYEFLHWGQNAFANFRVVPPATGIVHQVNLEYLAQVVMVAPDGTGGGPRGAGSVRAIGGTGAANGAGATGGTGATGAEGGGGGLVAYPDTLVGTDSHTTMINGLGVLGWGVGGIEAEAALLGQPYDMVTPEVVGVRLSGSLQHGVTATDLTLAVVELLRGHGVVGKFVEFTGPGLSTMSLPDRATIANMAPEYGATVGFFPVDEETLRYLRLSGRPAATVNLVEAYCKEQGLFRSAGTPEPHYSELLELDMGTVEPALAGPKRPQDRVALPRVQQAFRASLAAPKSERGFELSAAQRQISARVAANGHGTANGHGSGNGHGTATSHGSAAGDDSATRHGSGNGSGSGNGNGTVISHGAVVIAAITSCTNTSNPSVMLGAGILARKAVARGLKVPPYVKTSLAPGSTVVTDYLRRAEVLEPLAQLGFDLVGYGCTTCIGNSGPLPEAVARAVTESDLVVASVLSGNRNFEGRVHAQVKANYLASPPLVVAYALAGTVDRDLTSEPLGTGSDGASVYLRDIWPTDAEVAAAVSATVQPEMFRRRYANVLDGNAAWNAIGTATAATGAPGSAAAMARSAVGASGAVADPAVAGGAASGGLAEAPGTFADAAVGGEVPVAATAASTSGPAAAGASVASTSGEVSAGGLAVGPASAPGAGDPADRVLYAWDADSTYVREPPFFATLTRAVPAIRPISGARALAVLGDSITTDHISPAGAIPADGPAGRYLQAHGVAPADFNSFGARRGNHEVMMRGTFANIRLKNALAAGGQEGGYTVHLPSSEPLPIYDAAMRYRAEGVPLVVLGGREYGSGSSRDWAAKGPMLLGVRAVIVESFERIHRSNLVGMGVLPLQYLDGATTASLGLSGRELFSIEGLDDHLCSGARLTVRAVAEDGSQVARFPVLARIDTATEVEYYRHGGILQLVLRQMLEQQ